MSNKGFTLLEVLVAISLLTFGIGGAFMLVTQTVISSQLTESRLEAVYLAQEGAELVRNVRDANFLNVYKGTGTDWLEGLRGCEAGCEADFNDAVLTSFDGRFLKIGGGFYNYDSGLDTYFKRKIIISDLTELDDPPDGITDRVKVAVEIYWQERGQTHKITVQEFLYKWWQ
ncbi:MAG: prepilin-type N-terminal cleavage/methylation domain-containing protein [bacterium]|nr:prepilin-type N-terminal cleavage/methylation domain-containing protein [bacterium]